MTSPAALRGEAIRAAFEAAGAVPVETPFLLPADTLLDLYGEDIRARAYVTADPIRGELMLRPDFTVPVVEAHMAQMAKGAGEARYTYLGPVFRRQETDETRPIEYLQVGFEVLGHPDPAAADAEVFATIAGALDGAARRAVTGDFGVLLAAVDGLATTEARKAALRRHIWRPRRFRQLLDRFGGRSPVPPARAALLAAADPMADMPPLQGLRRQDEIAARIAALREDAATPPIGQGELDLIDAVLSLRETLPNVLGALADIAVDLPALGPARDRLAARAEALAARGVAVDDLAFEASFGRTSMEYYDGFVFGFHGADPAGPPLATGGRYDALTAVLGRGRGGVPAVGGVIRPELVLAAEGAA